MFKVKRTTTNNCHGRSLIVSWIFQVSFVYTIERGDHLHISVGVGPFEVSVGTTVWRKWLP